MRVLLRRYQMPICERFGYLPDQVTDLAWWQFEQAMYAVDDWIEKGAR
ncbi:MAG TPA: hypothetical protein VGK17_02980 [Propionicimonas sp.]